jgi:hypothetical protein
MTVWYVGNISIGNIMRKTLLHLQLSMDIKIWNSKNKKLWISRISLKTIIYMNKDLSKRLINHDV